MPQGWDPEKFFSVDEMTMGFKGNHSDKKELCSRQKAMDLRQTHCYFKMVSLTKGRCEMILHQKIHYTGRDTI